MSGTTSESKPRGLDGVVAAQTRMSHVDGQNGVLIIGGYELKELAGKVSFEEAAHMRFSAGLEPIAPRTDLSLAGNFLYMVFGKEPDPIAAKALDTYWVTVID